MANCNCEAKLLKLKANYNYTINDEEILQIVIARRSYLNWKLITTMHSKEWKSNLIVIARRSYLNWKLITTISQTLTYVKNCNCEAKLLKLKANYNGIGSIDEKGKIVIARRSYLNWKLITTFDYLKKSFLNCNCEAKLLKLKANYNL